MGAEGIAWFALRVKPKFEQAVASVLSSKGYETFLPRYRHKRLSGKRYRDVQTPLFPGYVFAKFDPLVRLPILKTAGVLYIVSGAREPRPVDTREIESLRTVVESKLAVQEHPFLAAGDRVRILDGPLRSAEGLLVREDGLDRLVVSITLLARSHSIAIERSSVVPVDSDPARNAGPVLAAFTQTA